MTDVERSKCTSRKFRCGHCKGWHGSELTFRVCCISKGGNKL